MSGPEALVQALREEDRRLRDLLVRFPTAAAEVRGAAGAPSVKETLADIAFWDGCAVRIFKDRLAGRKVAAAPVPEIYERQNRQELERVRGAPLEDVLGSYLAATKDLIEFLQGCWDHLKPKYQRQFALPLRHRRFHRQLLESLLDELDGCVPARGRAA